MCVFPAERELDDGVQIAERQRGRDTKKAPDGRGRVTDGDAELEVIAEASTPGRRRHGGKVTERSTDRG